MFQQPGYIENVSMRLSEVLADIGVDERILLKIRRAWLLKESMYTISLQLLDLNSSAYLLGSQSEGTTTWGLCSDIDHLLCVKGLNVIQDWGDWEPGVRNYIMIQDETISPGYCLLQRLRDDAPLPYNDVPDEHHIRDRTGRILVRNAFMSAAVADALEGAVRHGPAYAEGGQPGFSDTDFVAACPCKSWPLQARQWLDWHGLGQWPSDDMRRYCSNTGCFVVGVGSKDSETEEVEWRVSTSLAERCLMFNLNITQIKCYVLMKMMLKTFFKQQPFEDTISSFMCKTVLFHCIANTHSSIWRENNLLMCLSLHLFVLYNSILNENCPHFIIPGNNLMRGKISPVTKPYILEILRYIINSEGTALLGIECDGLGSLLWWKLHNLFTLKRSETISGSLFFTIAHITGATVKDCVSQIVSNSYEEGTQTLLKYIFNLSVISNQCHGVDKTACCLLLPWFCTTLGTVLASLNIHMSNTVSTEALTWISLGLNTDVSSNKLKLASMFYCIGDMQRTDIVLRDIEGNYDVNIVEPICRCHDYIQQAGRTRFKTISDNHGEEAIQDITAFCVSYLPCEINCIPTELRYEMFRSTQEDLAFRCGDDDWMDWAVVDSLPYLYFLQYKTYSCLGRHDDKQEALSSLARTIDQEPNLGHRETALNLLGQCMEQEQRASDALRCYLLSLSLRERNNAAKFHICRLLSNMIRNQ